MIPVHDKQTYETQGLPVRCMCTTAKSCHLRNVMYIDGAGRASMIHRLATVKHHPTIGN